MKGVKGFRKIWIWIFFIGVVSLLLSSKSGERATWNPAEQLIIEITTPLQKLIHQTTHITEEFWLNYFYLVGVQQENRQLKKKVDALGRENRWFREHLGTLGRLQELLQFKQTIDRPVLAAQVIGRDPTGWFKSVIIDKGKRAGLELSMPVVDARGVVGRIVSLSPNFSKVLLIIDQNSAVDCLVQRSRDRAMAKGLGTGKCKLDYVLKSTDVVMGDIAVTSGLGGVFPKGLYVGQVRRVNTSSEGLFKDIEIEPFADFSKLEEVLVILEESRLLDQQTINQNEIR
ncbi:MAG: rod shape-determining protein MreC [Deltaproteobacteria bacterium]|nr:rod shape-determining protein MreC [Deltaproteobacteria bacterium]